MTPKRGDLVHVVTHDIEHGNMGWQAIREVRSERPSVYSVVGWVVKVRKRTLTVAATTGKGKTFCYYLLPRGGITSIRRLK